MQILKSTNLDYGMEAICNCTCTCKLKNISTVSETQIHVIQALRRKLIILTSSRNAAFKFISRDCHEAEYMFKQLYPIFFRFLCVHVVLEVVDADHKSHLAS
jgi:hypothetical protein